MNVFLTGATGFIGRALVLALLKEGHGVMAWVRSPGRARSQLGESVELLTFPPDEETGLTAALERCDAVINLAGEPLFEKRWNARRKRAFSDSRVSMTARLVRAVKRARRKPRVLISGSAVGYYGDRGCESLTEQAGPGTDFLAELCEAWESATESIDVAETRIVSLRTGIVLGQGGGALERLASIFRLGLGGPLGPGSQFVPWIHLQDCVSMILHALHDHRLKGPVNLVAPAPVTNLELTRSLGRVLSRPVFLRAPRFMLRVVLGEAASSLLSSQRCYPDKATACGFSFQFPDLDTALDDLLGPGEVSLAPLGSNFPSPMGDSDYLRRRRPDRILVSRVVIDAPLEDVFPFFSQPTNLGLLTPPRMGFRILRADQRMQSGAAIEYELRVFGLKIGWETLIEQWEDGHHFVDSQARGPYRSWWHEHHFREDGGQTVMEDRVYYALPGRILGRLAHRLFVGHQLRSAFNYRAAAVRFRFGPAPENNPPPSHEEHA